MTPAPARSPCPRAMCPRRGEQPPTRSILEVRVCSCQAAHSLQLLPKPRPIPPESPSCQAPHQVLCQALGVLQRTEHTVPCLLEFPSSGETDTGQMVSQMCSCSCDGWRHQGAAEEQRAGWLRKRVPDRPLPPMHGGGPEAGDQQAGLSCQCWDKAVSDLSVRQEMQRRRELC